MRSGILVFLLLFAVQTTWAQYFGAITIDRPGQWIRYSTVKKHRFQVESGVIYQSDKEIANNPNLEIQKIQLASSIFRYGVTKHFEVRFGSQFTVQTQKFSGQTSTLSTIEGAFVGAKWNFLTSKRFIPDASLFLNVDLPVGSKQLVSDKTEPALHLLASHPLSEAARLEYDLGVAYRKSDYYEYIYNFAFVVTFSSQTTVFIEVANNKPETGEGSKVFDGGLSILMKRNFMIDIYGGKGLNTIAPDWFVSFGFGYRFPN